MPSFIIKKNDMKSATHTKSFELDVPIDKLFLLFSPEGEKLWVPGWDYKNIMGTTDLSEDYVFLTENHDHGTMNAIWIVKTYDPGSHLVQFYKIEPEHKLGIVTVKCSALGPSKTKIQVTYKYIALSKAGEIFVLGFSERDYENFIEEWQKLLSDYFEQKG
ncbi:hypothetical protein Dpo_5c00510 [Desulfotignum phosphitoxidans DSM 13687]|jgi:hypothetical protein|uniref:Activator of Hsp90 ATPase 1 family protein n=2 Tax=Desulfobacteraceae TaxID=213119 RepID=S0FVL7_9BACT|nr:hypothetical protein Dpo_5c00510 [Desulfotignum phosphitoxidans DSM 13687]